MKKIVLLSLAVILSVSSVFAKGKNPVTNDDSITHLRTQLVSLLDDVNDVNFILDEDVNVVVRFVINEDSKVNLLSVVSNNNKVSDYVKRQLSHQVIDAPINSTSMRVYVLPLKVLKK